MKYFTFASLALATLAASQSLSDLPECAIKCLDDAVKQSTSCSTTDIACICKSFDAIQGAAAGCVISGCGQDVALNKVLPVTQKLCSNAGSGSSNSGAPAPSPTQEPGNTGTVTVVPQPPPETEEPQPEPTGPAPTSPPVVTAGASAFGPVGGLAMLALGALAL